ncbi:Cullin-3 [Neurospora crassa OR74A]|uniref:Cullin-3 n=2 Tax=Neurospora crassa TaxID=5141 RepID=Q7SG66_NEUCR|nr:Cullin-3 [Neurospora crassa OR74A]EAA35856.3 Cullin-3 [Neurospora crassa OR74A]CAE76387.1 related to cullulin 3 [Neurospora crassa]|eukprot:XP_965092.3 Cullin-3 [Neurospora crassa OR74A]
MASRTNKIRPIRKPITNRDQSEFEPCWALLRDAMTDIHLQNAGRLSFEQLYRASYKIVLRKKGALLYERVRDFEQEWFRDHIMPNIAALITKNLINISLLQHPGSSSHERREMGEKFLRGIRDSWTDHNRSMNMIADVLMYLDRVYTLETKQPSLFAVTIGLFRNNVLRSHIGAAAEDIEQDFVVFDILCAVILDLINMERDGDIINRNLVRKITAMLESLYETDDEIENHRLYLTLFEPRYLEASTEFYRKECEKLVQEANCSTWLRHAQRRLNEERERCGTTLSIMTTDKIASVVEKELIEAKLDVFLAMEGSGLKPMIDNDRLDDLSILYQLISRVDSTKSALKVILQRRVRELGLEIEKALKNTDFSVAGAAAGDGEDAGEAAEKAKPQTLNPAQQQTAAAIKWVDDVLQLKDKFDRILSDCFCDDLLLQSAITRSFSDFINSFNRSSEYVSLFIDDNLKRGIKTKTEAEVDAVLDKAIVLLRYLTDRDMFERYYQKHLAKRLLHGKSEIHTEKEMVSRMKSEMGNHFTSKFEGMFKDMELSKDLTDNYRDHIASLGDADYKMVDLNINVLTTNNWPPEVMGGGTSKGEGAKLDCFYPPEIKRLQESFYKYYLKDRSGRVLTWVSSAGNADIKCVFPKVPGKETGPLSKERRYELNVSTYGMIVLMLFNDLVDGESLSFDEIQAKTNIPAPELMRTLASLSSVPKCRVLLKEPATKNVKNTDKFSYNAQFVSKAIRIKAPVISSISKVEGDEERKETERKNDQTRAHVIDAAVVRIMKQRKLLAHTKLVNEVISQLMGRFKPDVPLIKKRIEDLLAREYLERVEGDSSTYRYLA